MNYNCNLHLCQVESVLPSHQRAFVDDTSCPEVPLSTLAGRLVLHMVEIFASPDVEVGGYCSYG